MQTDQKVVAQPSDGGPEASGKHGTATNTAKRGKGKTWTCDFPGCSAVFDNRKLFNYHCDAHAGIQYICHGCRTVFARLGQLKGHWKRDGGPSCKEKNDRYLQAEEEKKKKKKGDKASGADDDSEKEEWETDSDEGDDGEEEEDDSEDEDETEEEKE